MGIDRSGRDVVLALADVAYPPAAAIDEFLPLMEIPSRFREELASGYAGLIIENPEFCDPPCPIAKRTAASVVIHGLRDDTSKGEPFDHSRSYRKGVRFIEHASASVASYYDHLDPQIMKEAERARYRPPEQFHRQFSNQLGAYVDAVFALGDLAGQDSLQPPLQALLVERVIEALQPPPSLDAMLEDECGRLGTKFIVEVAQRLLFKREHLERLGERVESTVAACVSDDNPGLERSRLMASIYAVSGLEVGFMRSHLANPEFRMAALQATSIVKGVVKIVA